MISLKILKSILNGKSSDFDYKMKSNNNNNNFTAIGPVQGPMELSISKYLAMAVFYITIVLSVFLYNKI